MGFLYPDRTVNLNNLNLSKVKLAKNAFYGCTTIEGADNLSGYMAAPTATPKPTATPTPNPEKPRKAATLEVGNNITYEFWDNGVMYVKGKGAVPDKPDFWALDEEDDNPTGYTLVGKIHTLHVEEGISDFGTLSLVGVRAEEVYLPSTYQPLNCGDNCLAKRIHGYYEGKAFTATSKVDNPWLNICDPFETITNPDYYYADKITITWE